MTNVKWTNAVQIYFILLFTVQILSVLCSTDSTPLRVQTVSALKRRAENPETDAAQSPSGLRRYAERSTVQYSTETYVSVQYWL